jgi:hypothetical protein
MFKDYPNFTEAQRISEQYKDYPIVSWQKMFKEIYDTLKEYPSSTDYE